jgi:hypothetical protein
VPPASAIIELLVTQLAFPALLLAVRRAPRTRVQKGLCMARQQILDQITQTLGSVPGWLDGMPDPQLEYEWGRIAWLLGDSRLSARDKALVSFGAAGAVHCPY